MNNENKYRILRLLQTVFHQQISENTTKLSSWQKRASIQDGSQEEEGRVESGHVTGNFAVASCEGLQRARQTMLFSDYSFS